MAAEAGTRRFSGSGRLALAYAVFLPIALALTISAGEALGRVGTGGVLAMGLLCWTLIEYGLHRFAFHYQARSKLGVRIVYFLHLSHHEAPEDPKRTVASPLYSIPIAIVTFLLFLALTRNLAVASILMSGVISGYLYYETIHFSLHHSGSNMRLLRLYRRYHLHHHYQDDTRRFGVTTPIWDLVFRTG